MAEIIKPENPFTPRPPDPVLAAKGFAVDVLTALVGRNKPVYTIDDVVEKDIAKSEMLRNPVWGVTTFLGGSYVNNKGETVDYNGVAIEVCVTEVSLNKNIVHTQTTGGATVFQFINLGSYMINIKGALVGGAQDVYPKTAMLELKKIAETQISVKVNNYFLNEIYDIHDIIVSTCNFHEVAGALNVQTFELRCFSDSPLELKLKD